ncbi:hypothetical protein LCGC14_0729560 [marine sediment metagenome]|uniref:Uncharacterized protein n=1 Tax=marine sediment metagenome TaxID=412755 RepID=A0A0F9QE80_9ZZZZ
MEVKFVSLFIHEEQHGFLYEGINPKSTGWLFDRKEQAQEHQEISEIGYKPVGVLVVVVD